MSSDVAEIEKVLQVYFDGLYEGDTNKLGEAFHAASHLYAADGDKIRLSIHDGDLLTGSLVQPGFATSVHPDWSALPPLEQPKARIKEQAL